MTDERKLSTRVSEAAGQLIRGGSDRRFIAVIFSEAGYDAARYEHNPHCQLFSGGRAADHSDMVAPSGTYLNIPFRVDKKQREQFRVVDVRGEPQPHRLPEPAGDLTLARQRLRKVALGATINGTYKMLPEPSLEAFRADILLVLAS